MDKLVERLVEMDAKLGAGPWCKDYMYSAIRHVERNCDIECITHEHSKEWDACKRFDRYDGPMIAEVRNALPALVEYVKACDDLAAEYAHYLNKRDGVQRELDPYDAARAALLSALGGGAALAPQPEVKP